MPIFTCYLAEIGTKSPMFTLAFSCFVTILHHKSPSILASHGSRSRASLWPDPATGQNNPSLSNFKKANVFPTKTQHFLKSGASTSDSEISLVHVATNHSPPQDLSAKK